MPETKDNSGPIRPFDMVKGDMDRENPVDVMVAERAPQDDRRERIRFLGDGLAAALGDKQKLWLEVEGLIRDYHTNREEEYFNVGYEYGIAAGRSEAIDQLIHREGRQIRELADSIRTLCKNERLPASQIVAALLQAAWVFTFELKDSNTK